MKRIAAYIGDYYHPAKPIRQALESALHVELKDGSLAIRFAESPEQLTDWLERDEADAAILFAEDRVAPEEDPEKTWMNDEKAARIVRFVERGGGWLAWHSGLASYPEEGVYVRMLKGHFVMHPAEHQAVRYAPEGEAVPPGSFEIADEHYFVHCDEAETEVFLRSESVDGRSVAGWRHRFGNGRVCCLTPAHRPAGLADEAFQSALRACARWTIGAHARND